MDWPDWAIIESWLVGLLSTNANCRATVGGCLVRMGPSPTFDQFGTSPTPDRGGKRSNLDFRLHITPLHFFFQLRFPIQRKLKLAQVHKQRKAKRKKLFISRVLAMATNTQDQQSQAGRHQEVGHKSLLQSDALYQVSSSMFQLDSFFAYFESSISCLIYDLILVFLFFI